MSCRRWWYGGLGVPNRRGAMAAGWVAASGFALLLGQCWMLPVLQIKHLQLSLLRQAAIRRSTSTTNNTGASRDQPQQQHCHQQHRPTPAAASHQQHPKQHHTCTKGSGPVAARMCGSMPSIQPWSSARLAAPRRHASAPALGHCSCGLRGGKEGEGQQGRISCVNGTLLTAAVSPRRQGNLARPLKQLASLGPPPA